MPILAREPDIYPDDLLERDFDTPNLGGADQNQDGEHWWVLYTRSQQEKKLLRHLRQLRTPHYCPISPQRIRSPSGRIRTSFKPLFAGYVFLYGDGSARYDAMTSSCVSKYIKVSDGARLAYDLAQIRGLIEAGASLTPESRLLPGDEVRIRTGPFKGYEGRVMRREGQTRFLVYVAFLQQGASMILEDCEVEASK